MTSSSREHLQVWEGLGSKWLDLSAAQLLRLNKVEWIQAGQEFMLSGYCASQIFTQSPSETSAIWGTRVALHKRQITTPRRSLCLKLASLQQPLVSSLFSLTLPYHLTPSAGSAQICNHSMSRLSSNLGLEETGLPRSCKVWIDK
jgi:hypothetical protein